MRTFQKFDYFTLCDWMKWRAADIPAPYLLPPTGLIIEGIACGFLIKCDNGFGIIDFFITNPKAEPRARGLGVALIARELIQVAKRDGIKMLKCDTDTPSIYRLSKKLGFRDVGLYSSMLKELAHG